MTEDQKTVYVGGVILWVAFTLVGLAFNEIKFTIAGIVVLVAAAVISVVIGDN